MEENEEKDSQVADGALQNLQEAIQIGRTDVIVRTIDLATKRTYSMRCFPSCEE